MLRQIIQIYLDKLWCVNLSGAPTRPSEQLLLPFKNGAIICFLPLMITRFITCHGNQGKQGAVWLQACEK